MKKVLVIVYAWPPAGGPGVQRCLKFAKYLSNFGWEPVILTVRNPEKIAEDDSLLEDIPNNLCIYKTSTLEPFALFKKLTGRKPEENLPQGFIKNKDSHSLMMRIAFWMRLNLFIPDAKIGWFPFAVLKGANIIKRHGVSMIFSSGPPQTAHLIGRCLSRKMGLPWVVDFRDPWTDINYFKVAKRKNLTNWIDKRLEHNCLKDMSAATTVTQGIVDLLSQKIQKGKFNLLPNGFDEDDFKLEATGQQSSNPLIQIYHGGSIGIDRIPHAFISALVKLTSANEFFPLKFYQAGGSCPEFLALVEQHELKEIVVDLGYLRHSHACWHTANSNILLLIINRVPNNKHIATGKIFEYMGAKIPILGIGPVNGDAAKLLKETDSGKMFDYEDFSGVENFLREYQSDPEGFRASFKFDCERYTRRNLTKHLAALFDELS